MIVGRMRPLSLAICISASTIRAIQSAAAGAARAALGRCGLIVPLNAICISQSIPSGRSRGRGLPGLTAGRPAALIKGSLASLSARLARNFIMPFKN
jgi:hypothetical protein